MHITNKSPFGRKTKSAEGEQDLNNAMMVMLRQLRNTLSRNTGYGWNIHEVHEVFFHLVRQSKKQVVRLIAIVTLEKEV
jgi:hypothetical protein